MTHRTTRELSGNDADLFARFSCYGGRRKRWTKDPEIVVRDYLAGALQRRSARALGLWLGDAFVGVAAWMVDPKVARRWQLSTVAIQNGHHRHGHGRYLKQQVLDLASGEGMMTVISFVDHRNEPMLELNEKLGCHFSRDPDNRKLMICRFDLLEL